MSVLTRLWLQRMEALAAASPKLYYTFVWILASIGYGYLLLFPALIITFLSYLVYTMAQNSPLAWAPLDWLITAGLIVGITLSSWVTVVIFNTKPELPAGKPLDAESFPILIDRIAELCATYNAPAIHNIKLTTHFRTELIRTPTTGFPSSYTNTLLLGLPVMSCMSPFHFKLLLARQIGHLAKTRECYSRRIVYIRDIWNIYARHYNQPWQPETSLLRLFFCWYASFFNTCTIPAARHDVFVKDQCMLEITPAENAAEAIAVFSIKKCYLKYRFWPELNESAFKAPKPAYLPFQAMDSVITKTLDTGTAKQYYEMEINHEPEIDSITPNLHQRLTAIGYENFIIPKVKKESAIHHFFGKQASSIQRQFDNIWYLKNKSIWGRRYKQGIEEKKRLKLLREQAAQSLLSNAEAKEYLLLIEKYVDPEKALPLYQEIIKTNLMDANVCYELGRLLLTSGDATGVDALQIAMDISKERTIDCCHHIVEYMVKIGDTKEAQHYRRMIIEHQVAH